MSEERTFLHSLNNRLAVAYGNGKLVLKRLSKSKENVDLEELTKRIEKCVHALDEAAALISERRNELIRRDQQQDDGAA